MTISPQRQPAGVPTGGQFAPSTRDETSLALDQADDFPRRPDGRIDVEAAIQAGLVEGFYSGEWPEPRTQTLVGHWEGNSLVIEAIHDGEVNDARPDTGYWPEGLWCSAGTGSSTAEIAASMLDEYEECDHIRAASDSDDYTPDEDDEDEVCAGDECNESLDDNEGYDGYCGSCADLIYAHEEERAHVCSCAMSEASLNACAVHGPGGSYGRCPRCR